MKKPPFPYCHKCLVDISENTPAIEVANLCTSYPDSKGYTLEAINFTISTGHKVALLGPNGAGKSTFLKALVGIVPAIQGTIRILGHTVGTCQHQVTYLPQRSEIDWAFPISLYKLILSGTYIHLGWLKRPSKAHQHQVQTALKSLGLETLADRRINQLSVGQQQRGLLARALVHNADLFLLDEPFNAVDEETQAIMDSTFDALIQEGKTIVMATHNRDHLESRFDDALFIQQGKTTETLHFN